MPYINLKTNVNGKNKDVLQKKLGEVICKIPGKMPEITMIMVDDKKTFPFLGLRNHVPWSKRCKRDLPCDNREYFSAVIELLSANLTIPQNRIFVTVNAVDNWS